MNTIGVALVWCVLQVTLASFAGTIVYLLARRMGCAAGRLTTIVSLTLVLALSVVALSPWPSWLTSIPIESNPVAADGNMVARHRDPQKSGHTDEGVDSSATQGTTLPELSGPFAPLNPLQGAFWQSVWAEMQHTQTTTGQTSVTASSEWRWPAIVACVCLTAATVGLLRLVVAWLTLTRLNGRSTILTDCRLTQLSTAIGRELSLASPVVLKESPDLQSAATFGWRRPVLLLPTAWRDWTEEELSAVLAHELAHVARGDFAKWLLAQLAVTAHFYHPLVHWLASRLRLEQELAADAAAAQFAGGSETYLQSLAALTLRADDFRPNWAAPTFLPTRSMFIRRIEMLKRTKSMTQEKLTGQARFVVIGVLVAIGLLAGGLRTPGPMTTQQLVAAEQASKDSEETKADQQPPENNDEGYDFAYVPERFIGLIAIRPAAMARSTHFAPLAEFLNSIVRPGIPADALQQVALVTPFPRFTNQGHIVAGTGSEYTIFRTNRAIDFKKHLELGYGAIREERRQSKKYWTWGPTSSDGLMAFYSPDEKTLLSQPRPGLFDVMDNPQAAKPPTEAAAWRAAATGPIFGVVNVKAFREFQGNQNIGNLSGGFVWQPFAPLLNYVDQVTFAIDGRDELILKAEAVCSDPEQVFAVKQTVQSALVLLGNIVASQLQAVRNQPDNGEPEIVELLSLAGKAVEKAELTSEGRYLLLAVPLGNLQTILQSTLPKIQEARIAARRAQSQNNLKQIGLAFHNYHDKHGHFPPAVLYDEKTGTPYSWRVAILPYLEQQALHDQYRFDEPWDSEHNLTIAEMVLPIFSSPTESMSTNAAYYALVGPSTIFAGEDGVGIRNIEDGTATTILVVEAKRDIPWTKPEDIPYSSDMPLEALGGFFEGGFNAAFCDGSVRFISDGIDQSTLRHLIEKADRNQVDSSDF